MPQAPSLPSLIAIIVVITAAGTALDKLVLSKRLDLWRRKVQELWTKLNTPGARGLVQDANQLYCDLFDYVYGGHTFTWRRVWASILSSMIALVVVTVMLGYENTAWPVLFSIARVPQHNTVWYWVTSSFLILVPQLLNLIPDFLSLCETRLVLNWAKNRSPLGICFLIILDLIVTSTIFMIGLLILIIVMDLNTEYVKLTVNPAEQYSYIAETIIIFFPWFIIDAKGAMIFFLTTFVTSSCWVLFVLTFGIIWFFHRVSPLANFVYFEIGQSNNPALVLSGFLNVMVVIVYILWLVLKKITEL